MGLGKEVMVGKCEDEMDEGEGLHISSVFGVGMMKMKVTRRAVSASDCCSYVSMQVVVWICQQHYFLPLMFVAVVILDGFRVLTVLTVANCQ